MALRFFKVAGIGVFVLLGFCVSTLFAAPTYDITDLGQITNPGSPDGIMISLNDQGDVVCTNGNNMFEWRNNNKITYSNIRVHGINNSGLVVGKSGNNAYVKDFFNDTATGTTLPGLSNGLDTAYAVNNAGQIVGTSSSSGQQAMIWENGTNGWVGDKLSGGNNAYGIS
ncbi:MAG: hypothetical protein DRP78_07180, partial [Candidatus Omnitrophota bacterium]